VRVDVGVNVGVGVWVGKAVWVPVGVIVGVKDDVTEGVEVTVGVVWATAVSPINVLVGTGAAIGFAQPVIMSKIMIINKRDESFLNIICAWQPGRLIKLTWLVSKNKILR